MERRAANLAGGDLDTAFTGGLLRLGQDTAAEWTKWNGASGSQPLGLGRSFSSAMKPSTDTEPYMATLLKGSFKVRFITERVENT
ncbi:hypothetical protein ACFO7V_05690 [Glutamicibacter bergerei]|uniref:Uncharacterized protein n=2 Tax=Glutamicibacter TaxID=1742989 RepID=A0ABV9MKU6_9MICC|nr:hypothetical protein [Glutamicibacter ardleyensis]GGJ67824.1 hypothetical protein GCM10007173_28320 [Glutamicibacter ardleyensis]HAY42087.1 hypothetical protein [Micrococcaceae bacterium]HBV09409.1 hypothetical protein [Micrococcaceae bacterium]